LLSISNRLITQVHTKNRSEDPIRTYRRSIGDHTVKKILACIFMVIGHIGMYYADRLPPMVSLTLRILGSLSLPLFAYSLAMGFLKTRNAGNYFLRLLSCALVTQAILYVFLPLSGLPIFSVPLNAVFTIVCAFGLIYGCELLFSIPLDRIGSLHLIEENAQTHSDRYDVRIGSGRTAADTGPGVYIPQIQPAALFCLALGLIVASVLLSVFLNMEFGVFGVLTVLIFYLIEKCVTKNQTSWIFFGFLALDLLYILIYYAITRTISVNGASIASVFLCGLPSRKIRPPRAVQYAFYAFYPLHILALLLIRIIL